MKKLDSRGMTLVEILVSIVLISIVLLFLMNLFVNLRNVYNNSKTESEYLTLQSAIIKVVSDDLRTCDLDTISVEEYDVDFMEDGTNYIYLNFTDCDKKKLEIDSDHNTIKYVNLENGCNGSGKCPGDVVRTIPDGALLDKIGVDSSFDSSGVSYSKDGHRLYRIYIPFYDKYDTDYTINIYALKNYEENE